VVRDSKKLSEVLHQKHVNYFLNDMRKPSFEISILCLRMKNLMSSLIQMILNREWR